MRKLILPISVASTSCNQLTQSKSEPVTITAPESKTSKFETNDSSFLKLKIEGNKFEIELLKKVILMHLIPSLKLIWPLSTKKK
jgi:hypothetical protein